MDMVDSLKRILVSLRNEHQVIMETLDHAISTIDSRELMSRRQSFPPSVNGPLESLVKKVQFAVSSENSDPILLTPEKNLDSEVDMSMSTYNYLCKYDLLSNTRSPLGPLSKNRQNQAPLVSSYKILDEDLIKRMPKL